MKEIYNALEEEFSMMLSEREKMLINRAINISKRNETLPKDFYVKSFSVSRTTQDAVQLFNDMKQVAEKLNVKVEYVKTGHWNGDYDSYRYSLQGQKRNVKLVWKMVT